MENQKETMSAGVSAPLLDEVTTAELKAPILEAEERERESVERREQKSTDAKQLKDTLRLAELRSIPRLDRTAEQQREFSRLDQRQRRTKEKTGLTKSSLSKVETAEEFWRLNRASVDGKKIHKWLEIQESVLDQLHWLNSGGSVSPQDPDFVSLEEGVADLEDFVGEHGLVHNDVYQSPFLRDFHPYWGIWALEVIHDPIWRTLQPYWRDTERFHALCAESEATMVYAKFGIRIALPAYHLRMFRSRIKEHKHARMLGTWKTHVEHEGPQCWLCNFERLHGEARQ